MARDFDSVARIGFRVDASGRIGGGHLMRCLSLAHYLVDHECIFLCRPETAPLVPTESSLRPKWHFDRQIDSSLFEGLYGDFDILICDSYEIGQEREKSFRARAEFIAVLDDLANRAHDCDLLIDMSLGRTVAAYDGLIPAAAHVLAGSEFAILRPAFAKARAACLRDRGGRRDARNIVVSLGLTDPQGATLRVLAALKHVTAHLDPAPTIDVVIGSGASRLAEIRKVAETAPYLNLHIDTGRIVEILCRADIAIGAPGTSAWERCCLGAPSVMSVLAENQADNAHALQRLGAAICVNFDSEFENRLANAVEELMSSRERRQLMAAAAAQVCDGRGGERVVSWLSQAPHLDKMSDLRTVAVRRATPADGRLLWEWRNDPVSRANSTSTEPIPWEHHLKWLEKCLGNRDSVLLIGEYADASIGTVRFDASGDGDWLVSITVAGPQRNRGLAARLLAGACRYARVNGISGSLVARIRAGNMASQRAFATIGFRQEVASGGWLEYRLAAGVWPMKVRQWEETADNRSSAI